MCDFTNLSLVGRHGRTSLGLTDSTRSPSPLQARFLRIQSGRKSRCCIETSTPSFSVAFICIIGVCETSVAFGLCPMISAVSLSPRGSFDLEDCHADSEMTKSYHHFVRYHNRHRTRDPFDSVRRNFYGLSRRPCVSEINRYRVLRHKRTEFRLLLAAQWSERVWYR